MSSSDPHRGGNLTDMAEQGTRVPNDAPQQTEIPSVPRPDQQQEAEELEKNRWARLDENQRIAERDFPMAAAADNQRDMPRSTKDMGPTSGEVVSGTGDVMPPEVESKRLNLGAQDPGAKGSLRTFKHEVKKGSVFDRSAGEDADSETVNREHEFRTQPPQ